MTTAGVGEYRAVDLSKVAVWVGCRYMGARILQVAAADKPSDLAGGGTDWDHEPAVEAVGELACGAATGQLHGDQLASAHAAGEEVAGHAGPVLPGVPHRGFA